MRLRITMIPLVLLTALLAGSCYVDEGCRSNEWQCDDGLCILDTGVCDGYVDCRDGSDEDYCGGCYSDEWQCDDGKCILDTARCDDYADCYDGSDENGCGCGAGEFDCGDDTCIDAALVCNYTDDCDDASDEVGCSTCDATEFDCGDGACIDAVLTCDATDDCDNGADEAASLCTTCDNIYVCDDMTEIDTALVCDGTAMDCPDNSDEDYCWIPDCATDGFECENGVCWESGIECNGINECGDCSDEEGC